jgi:hypothetical protein
MNSRRNPHRTGESGFDTDSLLILAKTGDGAALGRLLERYRSYIGLLIRLQGRRQFRKNRDAEDLIHEIGLEIYRKIATFRGTSVHEFLRWLRRMIGSILADPVGPSGGPDAGSCRRSGHSSTGWIIRRATGTGARWRPGASPATGLTGTSAG